MMDVQNALVSDARRLDPLKNQNNASGLKKVAQEFEALFLQMALKSMREASKSLKSKWTDSTTQTIYEEMYHNQLALQLSRQENLKLAEVLSKQFEKTIQDYSQGEPQNHSQKSVIEFQPPLVSQAHQVTASSATHEFARELWPHLNRASAELNDLDPALLLAQCALETGWGKHSGHCNLFGIKADAGWTGQAVALNSLEFIGSGYQPVKSAFRAYESKAKSIQDYVQFIKNNPRYQEALSCAQDASAYIRKLQEAGYATDPDYAQKVLAIYDQCKDQSWIY